MGKPKNPLTAKAKIFCDQYLIHGNAAQAAREAKYKNINTAGQLMLQPKIREYIQKRMDDRSRRTEITQDSVLKGIIEVIEDAKVNGDRSNALKGLELLGKHLKLFTDVQEHKHIFTQMGRVFIGSGEERKALEFNIGDDPDPIDGEVIEGEAINDD